MSIQARIMRALGRHHLSGFGKTPNTARGQAPEHVPIQCPLHFMNKFPYLLVLFPLTVAMKVAIFLSP